jgi:hypothetical protein
MKNIRAINMNKIYKKNYNIKIHVSLNINKQITLKIQNYSCKNC